MGPHLYSLSANIFSTCRRKTTTSPPNAALRKRSTVTGKSHEFVNFQFVVQLMLVLVCLWISNKRIDKLETFASHWRSSIVRHHARRLIVVVVAFVGGGEKWAVYGACGVAPQRHAIFCRASHWFVSGEVYASRALLPASSSNSHSFHRTTLKLNEFCRKWSVEKGIHKNELNSPSLQILCSRWHFFRIHLWKKAYFPQTFRVFYYRKMCIRDWQQSRQFPGKRVRCENCFGGGGIFILLLSGADLPALSGKT